MNHTLRNILGLAAGLATISTIVVVGITPDLVREKIISGYNSLFADTTPAPQPPTAPTAPVDKHVLHRYFEGVDTSKNGRETYEIKEVYAPTDPQTRWGDVVEVLNDGSLHVVHLNDCIDQVGVNTNWTTLLGTYADINADTRINCGTNIQARCLVLQDGDCQPR